MGKFQSCTQQLANNVGSSTPSFLGRNQSHLLPEWSVDGIISAMERMPLQNKETYSAKEQIAHLKSRAKEAYAKREYLEAIFLYTQATGEAPRDAKRRCSPTGAWAGCRWEKGTERCWTLSSARRCGLVGPRRSDCSRTTKEQPKRSCKH